MPKEARILLIEDDRFYGRTLTKFLSQRGHTVVRWAQDLDGALRAVGRIGEDTVDVVILDGNLREGDSSGRDGRNILSRIRERHPDMGVVKVVWNSSSSIGDKASLVNIPERIESSFDLADAITKL